MSKNDWLKHMEETTGILRPSFGGDWIAWRQAVAKHIADGCPVCKARAKTNAKSARRREWDQAMRDCGLVKVRGACGGVYWE